MRFRIGNGVHHPAHGDGVVFAGCDGNRQMVKFQNGRLLTVSEDELESRPELGQYIKSARQLRGEAGRYQ
jgi:hypothetical protein